MKNCGHNFQVFVSFFITGRGQGAVLARERGVCVVRLPGSDLDDLLVLPSAASEVTRSAADQLEQYFKGCLQRFDIAVDISGMTGFQQLVLRHVMQVPFGSCLSYGELACRIGHPGASRAVGAALGANPVPVLIPCHRVVAATGALTGYSAPGGICLKRYLLELEGVEMKGSNQSQNSVVMHSRFFSKKR